MAAPWEKYGSSGSGAAPWEKYGAPPPVAPDVAPNAGLASPARPAPVQMEESPMSSVEQTAADVAAAGKHLYDISTPGMATELYKSIKGRPNHAAEIPAKIVGPDAAHMIHDFPRQVYDISTPGMATELYKSIKGQPNHAAEIPEKIAATALPMMVGDEFPAPIGETIHPAAEPAPVRALTGRTGIEQPASSIAPPKQLGGGVIDGEYVDAAPPPIKPAIANLPPGQYEARGGFEPTQPALPAKQPISLPESFPVKPVKAPTAAAEPDYSAQWAKTSSPNNGEGGHFTQAAAELFPGRAAGDLSGAEQAKVIARSREITAASKKAPPTAPAIGAADNTPPPIGSTIPRTLPGDSALRQVLTGQDNANLLKIAKSRGINVTKEAQLKAGVADNLLINKIISDFSPEELQNARDTFLESRRNMHQFGEIGPEAWKTMGIQTFFPDVKIPATVLKRTRTSIAAGEPPAAAAEVNKPTEVDLTNQLQDSLDQIKAKKAQGDEQSRPFAGPQSSTTYGKQNRGVSAEDADAARESLRDKLFRSHVGFDPTMLVDAAKLGAYHVEAGLREFGAWSQKMVDELGEQIRPHLGMLWEQSKPFELTSPVADAPMFYSKAAKVIDEKVGGSAPGDSILSTLRNAGVKEQEIQWTGLDDYLAGKKKVSKADLQQFIKENQIKLEETSRGHDPQLERELNQATQRALNARTDFKDAARNEILERTKGQPAGVAEKVDHVTHAIATSGRSSAEILYEFYKYNNIGAPSDALLSAGRDAFNYQQDALALQREIRNGDTKYEEYTLPGDKSNYTEMLLRLDSEPGMADLRGKFADAEAARSRYLQQDRAVPGDVELQFLDAQQALRKAENNAPNRYKSGHFDERNILAHVRFDDRPTPGARKTLFIEEVQSDWHQAGKKKGYAPNLRPQFDAIHSRLEAIHDEFNKTPPDDVRERLADEKTFLSHKLEELQRQSSARSGAVPDAPFKTDWHELVMKRMLRHAAENDYDRMAWVTGEQTADRYDLSKHLDRIEYDPDEGNLLGYNHEGDEVVNKRMDPSELPEYIGKDAAERLQKQIDNWSPYEEPDYHIVHDGEGDGYLLMDEDGEEVDSSTSMRELEKARDNLTMTAREIWETENGTPSLDGIDLKVGGQWASRLYDQAIPNFVNKYAKKWGAKVGETEVTSGPKHPFEVEQGDEHTYFVVHDGVPVDGLPNFRSEQAAQQWIDKKIDLGTKEKTKVHSIDITPAMKKSVLKEGRPIARNQDLAPAELATA